MLDLSGNNDGFGEQRTPNKTRTKPPAGRRVNGSPDVPQEGRREATSVENDMPLPRRPWTWKNVTLEKKSEESLGREFRVDLFHAHLENDPANVEILMELGNLFTLMGRVEDGLGVDQKLVEIQPNEPIFHYNLACSQSLLKKVDAALGSLRRAIDLGYNNLEYLQEDSDLENIRSDDRFSEIVSALEKKRQTS